MVLTASLWVFVSVLLSHATAVKMNDWKTCSQSGFCRRGRALSARAKAAASSWVSPYSVDLATASVSSDQSIFKAGVTSSLYPDIKFSLEVRIHDDGVVRVRMDEVDGLRKRYDEAAGWALITEPKVSKDISWMIGPFKDEALAYYRDNIEINVQFKPLKIVLRRHGEEEVVLNGQGLLHMEHFRNKPTEPEPVEGTESQKPIEVDTSTQWFEGEKQDAWWEESFHNWEDTKPKGPESLSVDINFPKHGHVYGIPQHATSLSLPTTTGESPFFEDPYRLYNADVFEYIASSPMSLYGSIPLLHAHSASSTVAVFDAIASETWIDVDHTTPLSTQTHWISESGIMDIFILPGPTPADVFSQYATLTGAPVLPAHWALGYHQCRWNYVSSEDVRTVQEKFDEEDMPADVFWLDIEYSEEHKYMIWDKKAFPDPVEMIKDVEATGRKMVIIVDPHVKRADDYPAYQEASQLNLFIKPKNGEGEYEGWCWSGSSSWIDFFNPLAWDWWIGLFKTEPVKGRFTWTESTQNTHIWNDMNEPSIFNGPEITMPKDSIHHGGWEHRDVHNINGMLFSNTTAKALIARSTPAKRPFVLTRSFFAGSQRFGAMWTGDNMGTWEHMEVGVKMVLANGIAGMSFGGADVGGFFGNPEPEMLVRWYQLGAFNPFFRAHAHIDTKRREPYLMAEPYKSIIKSVLRLRYTMLPVWYTAFRETSTTGLPVLRPQYVVFPKDAAGFTIDDQFYIGNSGLLVKPITQEGQKQTQMYLAERQVYYDYFTNMVYRGALTGKNVTIAAELHQIPLLIRGGSIISTRERPRRSSPLMKYDPFTIRVALSREGTARGELYMDDGETYAHEKGQLIWRGLEATHPRKSSVHIISRDLATVKPNEAVDGVSLKYDPKNHFAKTVRDVRVEKLVVLGLSGRPKRVILHGKTDLDWQFTPGTPSFGKKDGIASVLVIKNPGLMVTEEWAIEIDL